MAKMKKESRITKPAVVGVGCLLGLVVAGVFGYVLFQQVKGLISPMRQGRQVARSTQDVAVTRGSINDGVSSYGAVEPARTASLSFRLARTEVVTVPVKLGQTVKEGQLLVQLDKDDLSGDVATAKDNLLTAQEKLDELTATGAEATRYQLELDLTNARAALTRAQRALAEYDAGVGTPQDDLARAQADLASAQAALNELQNGDRQKQIDNLQYQYNLAEVKHGEYTLITNPSEKDQDKELLLRNTMLDRLQALETAKLRYETDLRAAEAKVTKAGRSIRDLQRQIAAGSPAAERAKLVAAVETAQANVALAEGKLAAAKAGSTSADIARAEASVLKAQGVLDDAEAAYAEAELVAPFAGVISALNVDADSMITGASTVVTIVDTSSLKITAQISDIDVARVQAGQQVQVTFESLRNQGAITGVLGDIPAYGEYNNGLTTFDVPVTIGGKLPSTLRSGMTANIFLPLDQRDNVLLVPAAAVQYDGQEYYVQLVKGNSTEKRKVTRGVTDSTYTEITSGLNEGDMVRVSLTGPTNNFNFGQQGIPAGAVQGGPGR